MTRKRKEKPYQKKKKERNKLCYGSNESLYVLVATIKEKKKTEVTTTKKISQLLKCNTPSTTTITTAMGEYLRNKVNILTNEKKEKGSFSTHSPGSDDDGLTRKKEKKEITTIMQKKLF